MFPNGSTILFQGDSITDAFRRPDEPNEAFQLGNGYAFLIAAPLLAAHPHAGWRFLNRGVSGNGVGELAARWDADCLALGPNTLSILVGVNETLRHFGGAGALDARAFKDAYAALLERARTGNPTLQLILCEPFVLPCGMASAGWREHLSERAAAVRELAASFGARFVPLQSLFDAACQQAPPAFWAYDGIHATAAGFDLIARAWLRCVEQPLA